MRSPVAAGARFILQLDRDGDLVGHLRHLALAQAQRPAAETGAEAVRQNLAVALSPASLEHRAPLLGVERADRDPPFDGDRIWLLEKLLERVLVLMLKFLGPVGQRCQLLPRMRVLGGWE